MDVTEFEVVPFEPVAQTQDCDLGTCQERRSTSSSSRKNKRRATPSSRSEPTVVLTNKRKDVQDVVLEFMDAVHASIDEYGTQKERELLDDLREMTPSLLESVAILRKEFPTTRKGIIHYVLTTLRISILSPTAKALSDYASQHLVDPNDAHMSKILLHYV
jgi:hypothetical protein